MNGVGFSTFVLDTGLSSTNFSDLTLSGGDTAEYRVHGINVHAINVIGVGSTSNIASATTPIPNTTPVISVTSPGDGSSFDDSDSISFTRTAIDTEDGDISTNLIWTSDIDGVIVNGGSFTASLNAGTHIITADVTDSGGAPDSDSISTIIQNIEETVLSVTGTNTIFTTNSGEFSNATPLDS